ncbi:MAG: DUF3572 domain-containing protein [Sneathiella sp.]|nr:DUF3572 domain-containing protein [Sneathiella sp.]
MNQELANITALQIIAYLVSEEKYLTWLMNETGLSADDLRSAPDNPEILSGVLDFLLTHEDILLDCCRSQEIDPSLPAKIRPFFPGASMEYY